jgi:hypothetical protein
MIFTTTRWEKLPSTMFLMTTTQPWSSMTTPKKKFPVLRTELCRREWSCVSGENQRRWRSPHHPRECLKSTPKKEKITLVPRIEWSLPGLDANPVNRATGHLSPVSCFKTGHFLYFLFFIFFIFFQIFFKKKVSLSVSFSLVVHTLWVSRYE